MNTATREMLMDTTVEPISAAPVNAASHGAQPRLLVAGDVLQDDDRVVDDEAGRYGERHQREVVDAVAEQVHDPERPDDRDGHGDDRYQRRAPFAQEEEDDEHDERRRR